METNLSNNDAIPRGIIGNGTFSNPYIIGFKCLHPSDSARNGNVFTGKFHTFRRGNIIKVRNTDNVVRTGRITEINGDDEFIAICGDVQNWNELGEVNLTVELLW